MLSFAAVQLEIGGSGQKPRLNDQTFSSNMTLEEHDLLFSRLP